MVTDISFMTLSLLLISTDLRYPLHVTRAHSLTIINVVSIANTKNLHFGKYASRLDLRHCNSQVRIQFEALKKNCSNFVALISRKTDLLHKIPFCKWHLLWRMRWGLAAKILCCISTKGSTSLPSSAKGCFHPLSVNCGTDESKRLPDHSARYTARRRRPNNRRNSRTSILASSPGPGSQWKPQIDMDKLFGESVDKSNFAEEKCPRTTCPSSSISTFSRLTFRWTILMECKNDNASTCRVVSKDERIRTWY